MAVGQQDLHPFPVQQGAVGAYPEKPRTGILLQAELKAPEHVFQGAAKDRDAQLPHQGRQGIVRRLPAGGQHYERSRAWVIRPITWVIRGLPLKGASTFTGNLLEFMRA